MALAVFQKVQQQQNASQGGSNGGRASRAAKEKMLGDEGEIVFQGEGKGAATAARRREMRATAATQSTLRRKERL